jgi:hypothetical protein
MSLDAFRQLLGDCEISDSGRQWFPIWVERYAAFMKTPPRKNLSVDRDRVIEFLRSLRDAGVPAEQRLKAVAAIECYRDVVLCTVDPGLSDISQKLAEIAEKERRAANQFTLNSSDLAHSTGMIHLNEPQVIQSLRRECRLLHYSIRTEKAYAGWVARFLKRYGLDDEDSFTAVGAPEVKAFLSGLAIHGKVAPSTQNQAFNALLFLFRRVLQRKLEFVDAVRANRPPRLPVVLSRDQAQRLLGALSGRDKLMAQLMYGAGLRLMECLRLRVKDVAFDLGQIIVREGKGDKDRITVLPKAARDGLQFQIELVRNLRNSLVC